MKKILRETGTINFFLVICSGVLTQLSMSHQLYWLCWISFTSFFLTIFSVDKKESFVYGLLFGITIAIPSFYWMIPGSERFTGNSIWYGIIVFVFSTLILSLYFGLVTFIYKLIEVRSKPGKTNFPLVNALVLAALFTLGESLFSYLFAQMPWFGFHSGMALTSNLYLIQPASFSGIAVLSFFVLLVNGLFALIFLKKDLPRIWIPFAVFFICFLWGYVAFKYQNDKTSSEKPVKVALVNSNIAPEIKWNDSTGNFLVNQLLGLSKKAASLHPDLVVWTESAVPWTYSPDDDFVKEVIRIYEQDSATQLLGMNTDLGESLIYNSVYCILPNGEVTGRYDKRFLLSMVEERKAGILFPFLSSSGFEVEKGESMEPLRTPFGNAGIMICNESTIASSAADMVRNGADFFVNISNDGWFSDSYLVDLHFYNARLRAVENRKPLIINSNRGFSGAINASGEILLKLKSNEAFVETVNITPDKSTSFSYRFPYTFILISVIIIITAALVRVKK